MKIQYILLLIILFSYIKTDDDRYDIDDFKQSIWFWKSKSEGTYEINTGIDNYKVIGYLNNYDEKYTKLIVYEKNDNSYIFSLASYKKSTNYYIKDEEKNIFKVEFKIEDKNYEIHNVIGNVFNNDNKICYLVTLYHHDNSIEADNHFNFKNYFFYPNEDNQYIMINIPIISNVFVADIDGDKILEIIFDSGNRKVMKINYNGKHIIKDFLDYIIQNSIFPNINVEDPLSLKGTNAFIDVNSDCRNDLILTVDSKNQKGEPETKLLIYLGMYYKLNDNDDKYVIKYGLNDEITLYDNLGPFALGDFNDDGKVDLIFPSLSGNNVSILINQDSSKNEWSNEFCPNHKIQEPNSNTLFSFDYEKNYLDLKLPESDNKKIYYNPYITKTSIRTADFMSSGYHGFLVIMKDINSNFQNVRLYKITNEEDNLKIELETDLTEKFPDLNENLQYASFFDFGEDGTLDIIVVGDNTIRGFYRNVDNSNYFVTAQLSVNDKDEDYNLIEVGAGYHYVVTNNNGDRRTDYSWQLAQTGDLNLNLNYAYMGLGRTNNYLENLEIVSVSIKDINNDTFTESKIFAKKDLTEYKQYTPIIPKSQLIVKKNGNDWNIDLIVQPTEKIILMIVIIFIILLIILGIIIYLHIKEVNEDKNQAKEFSAWYS